MKSFFLLARSVMSTFQNVIATCVYSYSVVKPGRLIWKFLEMSDIYSLSRVLFLGSHRAAVKSAHMRKINTQHLTSLQLVKSLQIRITIGD